VVTFLIVVFVLELVLAATAMIDAARRPREAWKRAGQSKTLWMAVEPIGLVLLFVGYIAPLGLIVPLLYLVWIRPSVQRAGNSLS
jgi:hypothetical protein